MKVNIELTDEQAEGFLKDCEIYASSMGPLHIALRAAVIAARPKPLKVGDTVRFGRQYPVPVLALGTTRGVRWMTVDDDSEGPFFTTAPLQWKMADGSAIVWPES